MTSVNQADTGLSAAFQEKAIVSQLTHYYRCLNSAMGNLRERLILNNAELDERLRDLQDLEVVGMRHQERSTLLDWKKKALKELTIQYTKSKK